MASSRALDFELVNIDLYASKVKPSAKEKFELLENEYTIITIIGRYKSARIMKIYAFSKIFFTISSSFAYCC